MYVSDIALVQSNSASQESLEKTNRLKPKTVPLLLLLFIWILKSCN